MGLPSKIDPNQPLFKLYEGVDYKEFWTGTQKSSLDDLEHTIVREFLPLSGKRILDLGCGYGRLSDCYSDRFKQVVMFDASISLLEQAYERMNGQAWFIAGDINHLPFRRASFDNVLMVRVFHHITNSQTCLSAIKRVLCKDGKLIFSYSNKRNAKRIAAYLLGKDRINPFTLQPVGVGTTLIRHHPLSIEKLIKETGFGDLEYRGAGVLDKISNRLKLMNIWTAASMKLAPFFGNNKIAPWILCKSVLKENDALIETEELVNILQCPLCGEHLVDDQQAYLCLRCRALFPVKDNIIDLRPH